MNKKDSKKNYRFLIFLARHTIEISLVLVLIILLEVLYLSIHYSLSIQKEAEAVKLPQSLLSQHASDYPMIINSYEPFLTAQAAVILDNSSKHILFSKNPHLRFSMASTTKLMTALVALEQFAFNDILTVDRKFIQGSIVGFEVGEQLYFDDLLYAMLLPSGNDVSYIFADNYPGGLDAFIKRMNEKAQELSLFHTHFADPAGLNDDQNFTTAIDLARFSSVVLKDPSIARVVGTKRKVFSDVSGSKTYDVSNLNRLLGSNGVIGIKTGTTQGAGEVLTTAVKKDNREYIIVVMKSEDRFLDTQNLLDLITNNIIYVAPQELQRR